MFKKKLEIFFIFIIVVALLYLANNLYRSNQFKNNPIPDSYKTRIINKEKEVLNLMEQHYGFKLDIHMIVTDEFKGRLYGLTSYRNGEIKIYLNKKVMQESMDYIIESVIAHEYAHALLFKLNRSTNEKEGHSSEWQETCVKLGGKDCQQYVNHQEIIMSKMPFQ